MSVVLIDTSAYCRALAGDDTACAELRRADRILVCPIILGELLQGFMHGRRERRNRENLRRFLTSPRVEIVPLLPQTAEVYANILTELRNAGAPIPTNDIWIASCAMEHGAHLLSADRHFRKVPGLLRIDI